MKVLIYGAGNSIAIAIARYVRNNGHDPVLADTSRYARVFYSKYCRKKYVLKDPASDKEGFAGDLLNCIRREEVGLVVPTSDRALFSLLDADSGILKDVAVTFPIDRALMQYVTDKRNIPSLCLQAGIASVPPYPIDSDLKISEIGPAAPYVLKLSRGISGEGFRRLGTLREAERAVRAIRDRGTEGEYLLQHYIKGAVYGAVAVFENNALKRYHSYRYIRRFPEPAGNPTLCAVDPQEGIQNAMSKVLKRLRWKGFCQMDFILEEKTMVPYLIDINPVHWYSVPHTFLKEFNLLSYYLEGRRDELTERSLPPGHYTTIGLLRELQRISHVWKKSARDLPQEDNYMKSILKIKPGDFYWDPLPVVLAPFLKLLKRIVGGNG